MTGPLGTAHPAPCSLCDQYQTGAGRSSPLQLQPAPSSTPPLQRLELEQPSHPRPASAPRCRIEVTMIGPSGPLSAFADCTHACGLLYAPTSAAAGAKSRIVCDKLGEKMRFSSLGFWGKTEKELLSNNNKSYIRSLPKSSRDSEICILNRGGVLEGGGDRGWLERKKL